MPRPLSTEEVDVVVIGGGSAGFTAAYAAGKTGARTVIIENNPFIGGTATGGGARHIKAFRPMRYSESIPEYLTQASRDQTVGGFPAEYVHRLRAAGGAWLRGGEISTAVSTDPEIARVVMEGMLEEVGVDIWFLTQFVDVVMEDCKVVGVVVASEGGLHLIWCKAAVDASGDGDLAARAGAEFQFGGSSSGKPQPITLMYSMGGVDFEKFVQYLKDNPDEMVNKEKRKETSTSITPATIEEYYKKGWPMHVSGLSKAAAQATANGDFPIPYGGSKPYAHVGFGPIMKEGRVIWSIVESGGQNMGFGVDTTNHRELRAALIAVRKFARDMSRFFKKYVPGFENSFLLATAPVLGVRETRRIIGDYMLSLEDAVQCRTFDDAIGRCGGVLAVHAQGNDSAGLSRDLGEQGWFHVPFRVLLPKGIEGLLVAGRCISASHEAHGSTRHVAVAMLTGHAAGTAAALAASSGRTPRSLEVGPLQEILRSQSAII